MKDSEIKRRKKSIVSHVRTFNRCVCVLFLGRIQRESQLSIPTTAAISHTQSRSLKLRTYHIRNERTFIDKKNYF